MKKTNLIVRLFLVALVTVSLASCNKSSKNTSQPSDSSSAPALNTNGQIAYVQIDTIFKYYDMATEINSTLAAKQQKLDADLNEKSKTFQQNAMDFKDKLQKGLITQNNAQEVQKQLQDQEQNLYQLRDQYRSQLADESQVNQRKIIQSIMDYLKVYNKDKKYKYILANSFPSSILFADSTLDITNDVIKGLNKWYKDNKPKK